MPTYRSQIIPHAAALFAAAERHPGAEMFVNLLVGGTYGNSVEIHKDVDIAAEDAHDHPQLGRYFGTIHIAADGALAWIDLTDHAHALEREAEEDAAEEVRHVRGLRRIG